MTTGIIVPIVKTTTDSKGKIITTTTSALQSTAETTIVVQQTTTNSAGSVFTTSVNAPATLIKTTNGAGVKTTITSALTTVRVAHGGTVLNAETTTVSGQRVVVSGTKPGEAVTTTDAAGKTVVVTYSPHGLVSEIVYRTTTNAKGNVITTSEYVVVGASPTPGAQGDTTSGSGGSKGNPNLQSGAPGGSTWYAGELVPLLGVAMGVAFLL